MRSVTKLMVATLLLAGSVGPVAAQDFNRSRDSATGTVTGVYVQVARGLFIETRLQPVATAVGKQQWADVKLDKPTEDGRRFVLAELGNKLVVEQGDLVEMRVAQGRLQSDLDPAPFREDSRVVSVVAKALSPTMLAEGGQCMASTHADAQPRDVLAALLR